MHLREHGNSKGPSKARSAATSVGRIKGFFGGEIDLELWTLTIPRLRRYYERRQAAKVKRVVKEEVDGSVVKREVWQPISVATHRNELGEVKAFLKWCAERKVVPRKLVAELSKVRPAGRMPKGKAQLRVDEARAWYAAALAVAAKKEGAIAALCCAVFGLRCSEVVQLQARDVDDEGHLLWIADSKTPAGRRRLSVPEDMRPLLLRLRKGKLPGAWLFAADAKSGHRDRTWPRSWTQRLCKAADVPVVTAHGMRALHASLAIGEGMTTHEVAAALGHEKTRTTTEHYVSQEAAAAAAQGRVISMMKPRTGEASAGRSET